MRQNRVAANAALFVGGIMTRAYGPLTRSSPLANLLTQLTLLFGRYGGYAYHDGPGGFKKITDC